jgi:hypothetical protein
MSLNKVLPLFSLLLSLLFNFSHSKIIHKNNFSLLRDFTCAVAKDELEKHPEMRTIAIIELENNFPPTFSREILKCLPDDVAKILMQPINNIHKNNTIFLPKESMVIFVADKIEKVSNL